MTFTCKTAEQIDDTIVLPRPSDCGFMLGEPVQTYKDFS